MSLAFVQRPAAGEAAGLLVLHHGRGSDERDLIALADVLDPERRLHVVSARGPLRLAGWPGHHWYVSGRVGHPEPDSFHRALAVLGELHDELWAEHGLGPERTVLGGFSMGAVMSYAAGLDPGRPAPGGILALSGFVPAVPNWAPDLEHRRGLRAFVAHGRRDPVIDVGFARRARELLERGGLEVTYRETDAVHAVDPSYVPDAVGWLRESVVATSDRLPGP